MIFKFNFKALSTNEIRKFSFHYNLSSSSDFQQISNVLINYQYDLTPCLTNCSNNGICLLNSTLDKYSCNCSDNFNGESCQFDLRPCSKYPCLNNGTCINKNVNTNEFECKCLTNSEKCNVLFQMFRLLLIK